MEFGLFSKSAVTDLFGDCCQDLEFDADAKDLFEGLDPTLTFSPSSEIFDPFCPFDFAPKVSSVVPLSPSHGGFAPSLGFASAAPSAVPPGPSFLLSEPSSPSSSSAPQSPPASHVRLLPAVPAAVAALHPSSLSNSQSVRRGVDAVARAAPAAGRVGSGCPKRKRKTIQRKRQEQMTRLETLTATQHSLQKIVREASAEVRNARRTLYAVLKTARNGGLAADLGLLAGEGNSADCH